MPFVCETASELKLDANIRSTRKFQVAAAMAKPKILHMLDPRANVSPFDVNMAVDAGYEVVVPYSGTGVDDVAGLVQDAIFSRPPGRYNETGVFIGGHDVNLAADMLERARGAMVGPFEVAVLADPNGAYTTSAALVALIEQRLRARSGTGLEGRSVQILGGGPVGLCTAVLVAQGGGRPRLVRLTPMTPARAEPVERFAGRYEVELPWVTGSDDAQKHAALESADVAVCCAKAGVEVLSADLMARCGALAVVADVNAVPPSGIEGLAATDDGAELPSGALGIGALAIGGIKYKVQRGLLERMMSADRAVALDFLDAFELARDIVSS